MNNVSVRVLELDLDFDDTGVDTIVPRSVLIDTLVHKASEHNGTHKYRLILELGKCLEVIDYAVNYDPLNDDLVSEPIGESDYTTPHNGYHTLEDWIDCVNVYNAIKSIECPKARHYAKKAYMTFSHQVKGFLNVRRELGYMLDAYYYGDLELDENEIEQIQTDLRSEEFLILEYPDSQLEFFTGLMDAFYSWLKDV